MLIIIGTGLAGYMLAKEWRKRDTETPLMLITQGRGDFYSKPLLSTALKTQKLPEQLAVNSAAQMAEQLNATIVTETTVTSIDPAGKTLTIAEKTFSYHQLVLACGAVPITPALSGDAVETLQSVNNLEDYSRFRDWLSGKKHLAILGSGLVGCEFANDLLSQAYSLDIISLDAYPLAGFVPEVVGLALKAALLEQGVSWHLDTAAKGVYRQGEAYRVELGSGGSVVVDGVLSAVGLRANTALAEQAGLVINKGIVVDKQLRTSDSAIFALGDCAEVNGQLRQYVAPLLQCARTLAKVLHSGEGQVAYPVMPLVIKTPFCPVVCVHPPSDVKGQWQYETQGHSVRALFYDQAEQLRGFVLSGDCVKEKQSLIKLIPL